MKNPFLSQYYKPWTIPWIIQRAIMVIRERRLFKVSWRTLLVDFRFTRAVRKNTHLTTFPSDASHLLSFDEMSLFGLKQEYRSGQIITCQDLPDEELSYVNAYFDHVYVVNLEKRADKRLEMVQKLTRLKIKAEFFPAIDGHTPENIGEYNAYLNTPIDENNAHELEIRLKRKVIYSPGAWGTLKTYRQLIRDSRARGFSKILFLQDDAIFMKDFENMFRNAAAIIPANWKLLYLGASQHAWQEGKDLVYPESPHVTGDSVSYYLPLETDGAFAIGLHQSAFGLISEEIEKMNCSFDSGALRSATKQYRGSCFVLSPNLVIADVRDSDIRIARKQKEFASTVRWELNKYDDPFQQDLVSIIIPAYNSVTTIERSIRSLLLQSYKQMEIIVVDDFSTDGTPAAVKKLASEDSRIRYIRHMENQGCYAARNTGIRAGSGKYIAFQDADDISLPGRITAQLLPLCLDTARFTLARIIRSNRPIGDFNIQEPEQMARLLLNDIQKATDSGTSGEHVQKVGYVTSIYQRDLFEELDLFWENRFGSDAEFVERVLFQQAGIKIPKGMYAGSFLNRMESVDGLFSRIDKVLMISLVQGEQNLSQKYKDKQRLAFQEIYRKKFTGAFEYRYPDMNG